jgi:hypothetical protein
MQTGHSGVAASSIGAAFACGAPHLSCRSLLPTAPCLPPKGHGRQRHRQLGGAGGPQLGDCGHAGDRGLEGQAGGLWGEGFSAAWEWARGPRAGAAAPGPRPRARPLGHICCRSSGRARGRGVGGGRGRGAGEGGGPRPGRPSRRGAAVFSLGVGRWGGHSPAPHRPLQPRARPSSRTCCNDGRARGRRAEGIEGWGGRGPPAPPAAGAPVVAYLLHQRAHALGRRYEGVGRGDAGRRLAAWLRRAAGEVAEPAAAGARVAGVSSVSSCRRARPRPPRGRVCVGAPRPQAPHLHNPTAPHPPRPPYPRTNPPPSPTPTSSPLAPRSSSSSAPWAWATPAPTTRSSTSPTP